MNSQAVQGQFWSQLMPTNPSLAEDRHLLELFVGTGVVVLRPAPAGRLTAGGVRCPRAPEAVSSGFLIVRWAGSWGPPWTGTGCVLCLQVGDGVGKQQDLAGHSKAALPTLVRGLPRVLHGHRNLSPDAWLLVRPAPPFPDEKAGSERGEAYSW